MKEDGNNNDKRGDAAYEIADLNLPIVGAVLKVWAEKISNLDRYAFNAQEYNSGITGALKKCD